MSNNTTYDFIKIERIFDASNPDRFPLKKVYIIRSPKIGVNEVMLDTYEFCFGQNSLCHPAPDCWGWGHIKCETLAGTIEQRGEAYNQKTVSYNKKNAVTWGDDVCMEFHEIKEFHETIPCFLKMDDAFSKPIVLQAVTLIEKKVTDI